MIQFYPLNQKNAGNTGKTTKPEDYSANFPIINEEIKDVNKSTVYYIKKYYFVHAVFIVTICLALVVFSLFFGTIGLAFVALIIIVIAYGSLQKKIEHIFMQQFAKANGYKYQMYGSIDDVSAPHLQIGHSRYIEDMVSGEYEGRPISIYNFNCTVGYGKNARHVNFTVCEIEYVAEIPNIFLDSHQNPYSGENFLSARFHNQRSLSLEGDFNKYFTLYVPPEYEIEALQIFTPDIMAKLIDKSKILV